VYIHVIVLRFWSVETYFPYHSSTHVTLHIRQETPIASLNIIGITEDYELIKNKLTSNTLRVTILRPVTIISKKNYFLGSLNE